MIIKLFKTKNEEKSNEVIKEFKSYDESEKRYEELRERAICRMLDKLDEDLSEWLYGSEKDEFISLGHEYYEEE
jgi:hypothetical protein